MKATHRVVFAVIIALAFSCSASGGSDATGTNDAGPEADAPEANETAPDVATELATEVATCASDCGATVPVAGGSFTMGCVAGQGGAACAIDATPAHEVTVPAFEIDRTEVTVQAWARCVADAACTTPNPSADACTWGATGKELHPVTCITHAQAAAFCAWAGKRLCSEAEWEKAARGDDGRPYPWGSEAPTCSLAIMDEGGYGCGTGATFEVGSRPAGACAYGALDMLGNVWEWVADGYHDSYVGAPPDGSAWLDPPTGTWVARGGAYSDDATVLRASVRKGFEPQLDGYYLGLRCCK